MATVQARPVFMAGDSKMRTSCYSTMALVGLAWQMPVSKGVVVGIGRRGFLCILLISKI